MTADVSSLLRLLSRYNDDRTTVKDLPGPGSSVTLMTRDLLGSGSCRGGGGDKSLELDLDLQVPNGWEKRLDLKSGKVYLQKRNSTTSSHHHRRAEETNKTFQTFQDLNIPSKSPVRPLLSLFDDTSLELKLVPSSSSSSPASSSSSSSSLCVSSASSSFQSVCTLDKVKSALERAGKVSSGTLKKRKSPEDSVCDQTASPVAVGCPGCLSYVLVMKNNPTCPRCHSFVALPSVKRPKIDLNISV
ncbi:unnamed protein product [Eruca vesicaria subsp. sativa]|uniref:GIR1-like zinc ribbon domain-containing protein n=1 Tax=Eruca vesicaria subsp. sativa TaxID=29727 RepID=A0ABC8LC99_ERUVS|nr:unnamed protein product [Eruca vesicaria subsp. sativa]